MSQEPRDKAELSGTVRCAMSNGGSSPISPLDADRKLPAADIAGDRHTGWPERARAWANMAPVWMGLPTTSKISRDIGMAPIGG